MVHQKPTKISKDSGPDSFYHGFYPSKIVNGPVDIHMFTVSIDIFEVLPGHGRAPAES